MKALGFLATLAILAIAARLTLSADEASAYLQMIGF